jgi:hypothetical protein
MIKHHKATVPTFVNVYNFERKPFLRECKPYHHTPALSTQMRQLDSISDCQATQQRNPLKTYCGFRPGHACANSTAAHSTGCCRSPAGPAGASRCRYANGTLCHYQAMHGPDLQLHNNPHLTCTTATGAPTFECSAWVLRHTKP